MWCCNWQAPTCLISKGCFCTTRLLFICRDDLLPLFDQWSLTAVGRRASLVEISYLISLLFGYLNNSGFRQIEIIYVVKLVCYTYPTCHKNFTDWATPDRATIVMPRSRVGDIKR